MFFRRKLKIGIVGGCQAEGVREATLALLPKAEVTCWHVGVNPPDPPDVILTKLKSADIVLSQISAGTGLEKLQISELKAQFKNVHFLPTVVFPGFYPDLTYLHGPDGLLSGVHSDFHSRIAVSAFLLGLTPGRTLALYNAAVFARLGYFDVFPAACAAIRDQLQASGFNPDSLDIWLREIGPFMYLANHPHIRVLTTLCHDLYVRLGMIPAATPVPHVAKDHLSESFTWPIYQALAKRLGIDGSVDFQRPAWLVPQGQRRLPMRQYLDDVFAFYPTVDRRRLETVEIAQTRDSLALLLEHA